MFLKSNFSRALGVLFAILIGTTLGFGDTIRLKDGSIIKGKIVSFGDGKFIVLIVDGSRQRQLNFTAGEIESISFDNNSTVGSVQTPVSKPVETIENNSKVITVGQTKTNPAINPPSPAPSTPVQTTAPKPKPVEVDVKVLADNTANGWTNSGWVVKKGQRIRIVGSGQISLGGGRYTAPNGIASLSDNSKLMANQSTGALIAVIGDNNNDFIFIGNSREFVADRDGALFLGVNEGNLTDNSGAFDVKIEIEPELGY